MRRITIDCRDLISRPDLHNAFSGALSFPDWYGNNLDALHDQLTSLSGETCIELLHWEAAEAALGKYAQGAKRAIADAAQKNPDLSVFFE